MVVQIKTQEEAKEFEDQRTARGSQRPVTIVCAAEDGPETVLMEGRYGPQRSWKRNI